MIRKLRWKFICVTMAAVLAVLLLIIFTINAVNIWQSNEALDSVTESLLESGGTFQKNMDNFKMEKRENNNNAEFKTGIKGRFHDKELPFATRFFTVTLNSSGEIVSNDLNSIVSVTKDEAEQIAAAIMTRRGTTGWYQTWRYRVGEIENGFLLIVVEATSTRSSILSVFGITLIVGLAALLAIFALIVPLSKRVIRPIAETYENQRRFITDASHELKTPLTVISANAELLGMTCGENEWSDGILRQCEQMRILIGRMIQMSRLDEGEQRLTFERFDLSEAVYDTVMSFRGPADARGLKVTVEIPPDIHFLGDEGAIRQLISILMDNALKYSDKGGQIFVRLKREAKGFGRDKLNISVQNTFLAVASLETDKLFERFYRADSSHTEGNSYGLGLPIARSVAELHNGTLTARKHLPDTIEFTVSFLQKG